MPVKIVRLKETVEFNPEQPLEEQVRGSKQVIVDYSPEDTIVAHFMAQFERIVKSGSGFQVNIKFNSNHTLPGYRAERFMEQCQSDSELNRLIGKMSNMFSTADKKLAEIHDMCEVILER